MLERMLKRADSMVEKGARSTHDGTSGKK